MRQAPSSFLALQHNLTDFDSLSPSPPTCLRSRANANDQPQSSPNSFNSNRDSLTPSISPLKRDVLVQDSKFI
ncbi:hypothetical protein AKJ16_DCAP13664 [Drosera capensis]